MSWLKAPLQIRFYKIHTNNNCYVIQGRVFITFLWANKTVYPVSQQGINIVLFQMKKNAACGDSGPVGRGLWGLAKAEEQKILAAVMNKAGKQHARFPNGRRLYQQDVGPRSMNLAALHLLSVLLGFIVTSSVCVFIVLMWQHQNKQPARSCSISKSLRKMESRKNLRVAFKGYSPQDHHPSAHRHSHTHPGSPNVSRLDPRHSCRCRTSPSPPGGIIWGQPPPLWVWRAQTRAVPASSSSTLGKGEYQVSTVKAGKDNTLNRSWLLRVDVT